jgi:hypothetical protein
MLNFTQIVNKINRACGTNDTTYPLANKAIDVNLTQDEVWVEALKNNGWNVDDFNQTDYPIIYTDLVAGQRDYSFITDGSGNRVLDIYKVQIKGADGVYKDIKLVDQQSDTADTSMTDGLQLTGAPTTYDLTGNGIFLDLIPNASNVTLIAGLKVFIDRTPTYFTSSDTTKVSGIDALCSDYLYLKPAYEYARDKGLGNREALFRDLQISMEKIKTRYGTRQKNMPNRIVALRENNR